MQSILDILRKTTEYFQGKGVPQARLDAELLLARVLSCKRMDLYLQFERPLEESELAAMRAWVRRRGQREPLQYILGDTEFFGARILCRPGALIPRSETEELLELAFARWTAISPDSAPRRILDLGSGSGAIAIACALHFPEAQVTGVEFSEKAMALAKENATLNGVAERIHWVSSSWWDGVAGTFDLILSNPPYLTSEEVAEAEAEVRSYEPVDALVGSGPEGLGDLEVILRQAHHFVEIESPALVGLETGIGQHPALLELAKGLPWARVESVADFSRRPRFIFADTGRA